MTDRNRRAPAVSGSIATADRLRDEIDSGSAGDKIPFPDPAAAPLGTDDEAGGRPPNREEVARAAKAEIRQPGVSSPAVAEERTRAPSEGPRYDSRWFALAAAAALGLAGLALALL